LWDARRLGIAISNTGTNTSHYNVKMVSKPEGWYVHSTDNGIIPTKWDTGYHLSQVLPGTREQTLWAIAATPGSAISGKIVFEIWESYYSGLNKGDTPLQTFSLNVVADDNNPPEQVENAISPENHEYTDAVKITKLIWKESKDIDGEDIFYKVYLGKSAQLTENDFIGATNQTEISTPSLAPDTQYYWRVDALDNENVMTGKIFTFGVHPKKPEQVKTKVDESSEFNYFLLNIHRTFDHDILLDYKTQDGTAKAGEDYIATSGTLFIKSGETSAVIKIALIDDSINESNEYFYLILFNPQGASFDEGITEIKAKREIIDDDGWFNF